ncbi:hypothetical protein T492DRAFT_904227 [Pavlovales sp. CCMP2436]|nr:hypothetical protein T492DRAFT_904227 [Pavlovales sp. CCMP2436]
MFMEAHRRGRWEAPRSLGEASSPAAKLKQAPSPKERQALHSAGARQAVPPSPATAEMAFALSPEWTVEAEAEADAESAATIGASVANDIFERVRFDGSLSDDSLRKLRCIFEKTLDSAVDLLDHATITRITPRRADTRAFWKVPGTSGSSYHCFSGYCNCQAFAQLVARATNHPLACKQLVCKHQLAARLADSTGACAQMQLEDEVWGQELLRGCEEARS